jgi:hypothetical protein
MKYTHLTAFMCLGGAALVHEVRSYYDRFVDFNVYKRTSGSIGRSCRRGTNSRIGTSSAPQTGSLPARGLAVG